MIVKVDNIKIKDRVIINSCELCLNPNCFYVLTGENGSGKTLLLKKLFSLLHENYNVDLVDQNNNQIIKNASVLSNIALSNESNEIEKAQELLNTYGLDRLSTLQANTLSGGEKRLVEIMRCVYHNADIILIDEPTNDLDNESVKLLITMIEQLKKDKIIIAITHDDRLSEVRDYSITIKNNNVYQDSVSGNQTVPQKKKSNIDKKFVHKIFPLNIVSILFSFVFILLTTFEIGGHSNIETSVSYTIPDNQVNLYSSTSASIGSELLDQVMPISITSTMKSSSLFKQVYSYNHLNNEVNRSDNDNISFESHDKFLCYPIEYYDADSKKIFYTFDYYLDKYYGQTQYSASVNTNGFFTQPYIYSDNEDNVYMFDLEKFNTCISELESMITINGNHLQKRCVVIVLESCEFDDFLEDPQYSTLIDQNIYIKSNHVIDFVNKIKIQSDTIKESSKIALIGLIIMVCDSLCSFLYLYIQKNKVHIFKNRDIDMVSLEDSLKPSFNNRIIKLSLFGIFILVICILYWPLIIEQYGYIYLIITMVYFSLQYLINSKMLTKSLKNYYRWDCR